MTAKLRRLFPALMLLTVMAMGIGAPAALAQDGPRFSNWGPGRSAPDSEGPPTAESGASGSGVSAYSASGYAAPPRAGGPGCYDLRGSWWNDGRQTYPFSNSYSSRVYVYQYRNWIRADQDDGVSYYGQCCGDRIELDVYDKGRWIGFQEGTLTRGGTRFDARWNASTGSGTETWSR